MSLEVYPQESEGLYSQSKQEDGVCANRCPVGVIVKTMPHFEDVLELYYHCKLCSAPQAYIEQDMFVEHVQQVHPEHYHEPGMEMIIDPYAENRSAQVQEDELDPDELENLRAAAILEQEHGASEYPQPTFLVPSQIKMEHDNELETFTETHISLTKMPDLCDDISVDSGRVQKAKRSKGKPKEMELVIEWPQQSQNMNTDGLADEIMGAIEQSGLLLQQQQTSEDDTAPDVEDYDSQQSQDSESTPKLRQMKLGVKGKIKTEKRATNVQREIEKLKPFLYMMKPDTRQQEGSSVKEEPDNTREQDGSSVKEDGSSVKDNTPFTNVADDNWQDALINSQYTGERFRMANGPVPRGACKICDTAYTHKHVATCVKKHTTEKPSCDAYVCAVGKSIPVYPCVRCDRTFLSKKILLSHISIHAEGMGLTCDLCDKDFKHSTGLVKHLLQCKGRFECKKCHVFFRIKQSLIRHLQAHEGIKPHICHFCGKGFNSTSTMKIHIRNHTGEKPYTCTQCPAAFKTRSHLLRHSYRHDECKKYMCEICGASYVDKSGLVRHSLAHTAAGKPVQCHQCDICKKVVRSKRTLEEHHKSFHAGLGPDELKQFACGICGKKFRNRRNVLLHGMKHTGHRPFKCEYCPKKFYKSTDVKLHERIHTGEKPYTCKYCGRAFSNPSNLSKHRYIHTGKRPFSCQLCGRTFNDKSHLNRHIKVHTGEKPWECDICNRKFATKQQMNQHMLVHSDVAPFICAVCGKTFRQRAKANKHKCLYAVANKRDHGEAYQMLQIDDNDSNSIMIDESGEPVGIEPGEMVIEQGGVGEVLVRAVQGEEGGAEQVLVKVLDEQEEDSMMHGVQVDDSGEQVAYHVVHQDGREIAYQVVHQ